MKTLGLLALISLGVDTNLFAQERESDALYLTGEADAGGSFSGGRGEAEWLHWISTRTSMTLGGSSIALGDLWWTSGTVGAFARRERVMLSGRLNLGAGRQHGDGIAYFRYSGSATVPIADGFFAEIEGQHARLADTATTVVKVGGVYAGVKTLTLGMAHYSAFSKAAHGRSISARADLNIGRVGAFGGATGTAQGVRSIDLPQLELLTHASREFFAGASVVTQRGKVICAVESVRQPGGRLTRVTATVRLPLGSRTTLSPGISR